MIIKQYKKRELLTQLAKKFTAIMRAGKNTAMKLAATVRKLLLTFK
jgi:hypothetical protein